MDVCGRHDIRAARELRRPGAPANLLFRTSTPPPCVAGALSLLLLWTALLPYHASDAGAVVPAVCTRTESGLPMVEARACLLPGPARMLLGGNVEDMVVAAGEGEGEDEGTGR